MKRALGVSYSLSYTIGTAYNLVRGVRACLLRTESPLVVMSRCEEQVT